MTNIVNTSGHWKVNKGNFNNQHRLLQLIAKFVTDYVLICSCALQKSCRSFSYLSSHIQYELFGSETKEIWPNYWSMSGWSWIEIWFGYNQKRPIKRQNWAWPSTKTLLSNVSSIHLQNLASIGPCYGELCPKYENCTENTNYYYCCLKSPCCKNCLN